MTLYRIRAPDMKNRTIVCEQLAVEIAVHVIDFFTRSLRLDWEEKVRMVAEQG